MDSVRILLRLKANVNAADEVRIQNVFDGNRFILVVFCFSMHNVAITSTWRFVAGRMYPLTYGRFDESNPSGKVVAAGKS